jgi:hemoglobin
MAAAVEEVCAELPEGDDVAATLMAYFVPAAEHLRNDTGLPITAGNYPRGAS